MAGIDSFENWRSAVAAIIAAVVWLARRVVFPSYYKRERLARVEQEEARARTMRARAINDELEATHSGGGAPRGERRMDRDTARAVHLTRELRERDSLIAQQREEIATQRNSLRLLVAHVESMEEHLARAWVEIEEAKREKLRFATLLRNERARSERAEHELEEARKKIVSMAQAAKK